MRFKYFFVRSTAVLLMLFLTIISGVLALIMSNNTDGGHVPFFPWSFWGDALVPLLLFMPALIFRIRIFAVAAILSSFINISLRITSIIIYNEAFMPLNYTSIKMLFDHSGHYALSAVLGKYYLFWLIPLAAIIITGIVFTCITVWKTSRKRGKNLPVWWSILFSALLICAIVSNSMYAVAIRTTDAQEFYTGHLVRPLPFLSLDYVNDAFYTMAQNKHHVQPIPEISPESEKILKQMDFFNEQYTEKNGELTTPPSSVIFDRIIVVAIESLDLEFIGALNKNMPENITPVLDDLIKKYPAMTNYYTAAQPTSWGLTALLLSRLDYDRECKDKKSISLFTIAATQEYHTYYFAPLSGIFGDNRKTYADIFKPHTQYFLEEWNRELQYTRSCTWGISDDELYKGVLHILKKDQKKRFLAVISTMDSHSPYTAKNLTEEEKQKFPIPFLQALHSTDKNLGIFLEKIMNDPELYDQQTLIVVTADHSATHGENFLKRPDFTPARIPLIFITPQKEIFNHLDLKKYASSIDLPPTLALFMGGMVPSTFMGKPLFSKKNAAFCWTHDNMLLVHTPDRSYEIFYNEEQNDPVAKAFAEFFNKFYPAAPKKDAK